MESKTFKQIKRRKKKKINSLFVLSFFIFSSLFSFYLISCGGGGGGGYSPQSDEPINPALFSGWEMTKGPFSGLVYSLAVDPDNRQKVFAAVGSGGLFMSEDGGLSWTTVEVGIENLLILTVAVGGDNQTIYIGTQGNGIYKSVNAGESWSQVSSGLPRYAPPQDRYYMVENVIIDPTDPDNNIVYALLDVGYYLYKTIDGGNNWEEIGGGLPVDRIRSFAIHPIDAQLLYAGTYQNGIFKSGDGGLTWTPINGNFPPYIVHFSCIGIDHGSPIDPDDDIIYAGTHDYGLYKTEDDGETWQFIPIGDLMVLYNFHVDALALDPVDKSIIYAYVENVSLADVPDPTKEGVYRSFNSGVNWERIPFHQYPIRKIVLAPNDGNVVYITTQGEGLFMTNDVTSVDDVNDWKPIDNGLVDLPVYTMILHPWDNETVCAGTSRGFFKTTDGGLTWERKGLGQRSIYALVTDPYDIDIVYAATDGGVYKTTNGGDSWSEPSIYQFNNLAIGKDPSPPNPNIIFGGNAFGLGIYRVVDDGSIPWDQVTWEEKNNGLSADEKHITCIAIDPSDPLILYAGTSGKVLKTPDGGDNWVPKTNGLPSDEPVYSLAIDPYNPQNLYAGTYAGFYASTNGGDTWVFKDGGLGQRFVRSITIDPMDSNKVCAGTYYDGAFASIDGGENWIQVDQGLHCDRHKCIISLTMDVRDINDPVVYAGTGCGVFKAYK